MLAGLPKAPSAYNPIANPRRAKIRQEYVLRRMRELCAVGPDVELDIDVELNRPPMVKTEAAADKTIRQRHIQRTAQNACVQRRCRIAQPAKQSVQHI